MDHEIHSIMSLQPQCVTVCRVLPTREAHCPEKPLLSIVFTGAEAHTIFMSEI